MDRKKVRIIFIVAFILSSIITGKMLNDGKNLSFTENEIGMMCLAGVYPAATFVNNEEVEIEKNPISQISEGNETIKESDGKENALDSIASNQKEDDEQKEPAIIDTTPAKPLVIIYHTHATESYQPISTGNFRTTEETGSVREVGNILAEELEKKGIKVVHDKTLHDAQSYNQSYTRSLETITKLKNQYPSAVYVIDLHRDAAAYTGNVGKTIKINGETSATFALVVGQGNPNADALNSFASKVSNKAGSIYPGFNGKIISKAYKYNQHVADKHILLEIGNNENNIEEAKICAKYFANIFVQIIQEEQQ